MNIRVQDLIDQARMLSPDEQAELLRAMHELVSPSDPEWEAAWLEECEARLALYEGGDAKVEDAAAVIARLRAQYVRR
jgi:hypothetical protein